MFQPITYPSFFNKKLFILLFPLLLNIGQLIGQNNIKNCFTSTTNFNPALQEELEIFTKNYINNPNQSAISRGKITIPVVVHIVTQESEVEILDEQVHTQITALNRDYNLENDNLDRIHPAFQDRIGTVGFNFCLATIAPDGSPTTGITRRTTSDRNIFSPGNLWLYDTNEGGQTAWDTNKYLNIWVTKTDLFAGYATKPFQNPPEQDGVVISPRFFGMGGLATPPFHLGRTVVHEVGHYFNLSHLFDDGCEGNDFVADTPTQNSQYNGCPNIDESSCGSRDITANFMNNSEGECLAMFTRGQAMRMQAALIRARNGLINNNGCEPNLPTVLGDEIKVYPNPASYYFIIEVGNSTLEQIPYFIYNSKGAKVAEGLVTPNSTQHFPTYRNGIYFIQFLNRSEEPVVKKVVINY